ncbi:MAG: hypothetical protein ACRD0D_13605, partial [Acidimicrobiales bacterium]
MALAVLIALGAASSAALAATNDSLRLTQPVQLTNGNIDPGRTYLTPTVAIHPDNPLTVVVAFTEARTRECGLMRSRDGGQTWTALEAVPTPQGLPKCFTANFAVSQVQLAFGRNGRLYYALGAFEGDNAELNRANINVVVARSDNLGDTWQPVIVDDVRNLRGADVVSNRPPAQSLVVDTRNGSDDIVYVSWYKSFPGRTAPNAEPVKSFVATSTDGGRTFGAPVEIGAGVFDNAALRADALKTTTTTTPPGAVPTTTAPAAGSRAANPDQAANFGSRNPAMTVDRKGTLYVAWRYQTANITPAPERALFLSKSTDRGKTFTTTPITGFDNKVFQALPVLGWSPEGGSQGTLHLV